MNKINLIEQFAWVEFLKVKFDTFTVYDKITPEMSGEGYWSLEQERAMYIYMYFGCLYSVLEGLGELKYDIKEIIPQLETVIEMQVISVVTFEKPKYYSFYDMMRRCRNAVFHVQNDLDRRKELMRYATSSMYQKQINEVFKKVEMIIEYIKIEINYYKLIE